MGSACALLASVAIIGPGSQAQSAEVPSYLKLIVGTHAASVAEVGTKNILELYLSMFELYDDSSRQRNLLAHHPVCSWEPAGDSCRTGLAYASMADANHRSRNSSQRIAV